MSKKLLALLDKYLSYFPEETDTTRKFRSFLETFDGHDLYDRKNFTGHITVSAIVADPGAEKFLLLGHRQLKKWLQPGGHVEASDAGLLEGACREVEEETGLPRASYDVMALPGGFSILDFDSHYIPASEQKSEGEHYHHDIRFLFRLKGDTPILLDVIESDGYKWVTREEFPDYFGITRVIPKIDFFVEIIE